MATINVKMKCKAVTTRDDKRCVTMLEGARDEADSPVSAAGSRIWITTDAKAGAAFVPGNEYDVAITV